ncbi:hypothetical protein [Brachybacterium hainanense]|uniref:Uncharacterized protein n=1 Tax=Brachybacterium hainanense TaxID=1541174 RepID=A0ABV6R8F0_9MICO
MLLIARASQAELSAALSPLPLPADPADGWSVGPTSPSGWTAAWIRTEPSLPPEWDRILLGDAEDPRILRVRATGADRRFAWGGGEEHLPIGAAEAVADALALPGGAGLVREALEEHLCRRELDPEEVEDPDADEVGEDGDALLGEAVAALSAAVPGLPELERVQAREITLDRGDAARAREIGRMAADAEGQVRVTPLDAGWFAIASLEDPGIGPDLFFPEDAQRDRWVLSLFRDAGSGCGLSAATPDDVPVLMLWNTGWIEQTDDGAARREEAEALIAALGPDVDAERLRALFRETELPGDPLAAVLDALRIPREALLVLDGDPAAPEGTVLPQEQEQEPDGGGLLGGLRRLLGGRG